MNLINKYKVVLAVVLPVLILILLRTFGSNHFQSDAKRWAESSFLQSNIITAIQNETLPGEKLIINLSKDGKGNMKIKRDTLNISTDSIISINYLEIIRKHEGPILLFSSDEAVSARIWMLLSQMGFKNIFILSNTTDNEVFKYKFRPDTLVKPEL